VDETGPGGVRGGGRGGVRGCAGGGGGCRGGVRWGRRGARVLGGGGEVDEFVRKIVKVGQCTRNIQF
jgi:hypothetical protein